MRIAVVNEISTVDRNPTIISVLKQTRHEIINAGLSPDRPEQLTYLHTGLLAALLLNTGVADFVVGGCGTGIGFLNSILQYPGVVCGLLREPLDSWLFSRINGGNAVSLQLRQGHGWAGEANINLTLMTLFADPTEWGAGYPEDRKQSQAESRQRLAQVSKASHRSMREFVEVAPDDLLLPVLTHPGITELLGISPEAKMDLSRALYARKVRHEHAR